MGFICDSIKNTQYTKRNNQITYALERMIQLTSTYTKKELSSLRKPYINSKCMLVKYCNSRVMYRTVYTH